MFLSVGVWEDADICCSSNGLTRMRRREPRMRNGRRRMLERGLMFTENSNMKGKA